MKPRTWVQDDHNIEIIRKMWIPISTLTTLCLLIDLSKGNLDHRKDDDLETIFTARSPDDWATIWHKEFHSRCREKLIRHLYWACEKDIYRLTRRNGGMKTQESVSKRSGSTRINEDRGMIEYPWLSPEEAHVMFRTRRNDKPTGSITQECCTKVGCTWEEYAEYCPSNKRLNQYKN
uniref:CSON009057 protein n=1 Tax=Culicoides sonorensis TaxID=179676 RepID=A0A336LZN9_CULSO